MKLLKKRFNLSLLLLLLVTSASIVHAQTDDVAANVEDPAAVAAKQLASRDPLVRQHAAEELARLEAADQRRLIEGYRLQEKNTRVKLALDWALYRTGKTDALFTIVRALDTSRFEQANSYLSTLENPEPLYLFLERMNGNTQLKLLEVFAKIGDADTIERLKPYSESPDPKIAEAAQQAARSIEQRLGQTPANSTTRPRQVGTGEALP
jgi:HEAT repeat protein